MFQPTRRFWGLIPPGLPVINWGNPITTGLITCFVPSASPNSKIIYDLTYRSNPVTLQASAAYSTWNEGVGLIGTVASSGAEATASSNLLLTGAAPGVSLFWRGTVLALGLTKNVGQSSQLIGLTYDNAGSSPFFACSIIAAVSSTNDAGLMWDVAGVSAKSSATTVPVAGAVVSYGGTLLVGGNALFYVNGALFNSTAFGASNITYGTAPQLCFGTDSSTGTGFTNAISSIACIWNRALSASEMASLGNDPYQMLIFPNDFIL